MAKESNKHSGRYSQTGTAFFEDVVAHGAHSLCALTNMTPESAEQVAHHLAVALQSHWGGSMLYVPKTDHLRAHKRDLQIWNDFTGDNHNELGRKYDLSVITIYQILARVREQLRKENQGDLFD